MPIKMHHKPYEKLKLKFAGLGVTYQDVADVIGKAYQSVVNKMNGRSDFKFNETRAIQKKWDLKDEDFN